MPKSYLEILETFDADAVGRSKAWGAVSGYAGILTAQDAQDRFAVGVRTVLNGVGQRVHAVVLVDRSHPA